ncbi:hypothetical protein, partial [Vibrio campbellii]
CLQPPPAPPFLDMVCQAFGCGYQGGGLFFAAVSSVLSHRHSEGAQAIIQDLLSARCYASGVN